MNRFNKKSEEIFNKNYKTPLKRKAKQKDMERHSRLNGWGS